MIAAIGVLAALLAIATPAWAQQTVRIGTTPAVTFVVLYGAEQLGYFKAEGITAQFADFEGGAEVTTAMVGGSIDFAGTYVERPMILAEKGFGSKNLSPSSTGTRSSWWSERTSRRPTSRGSRAPSSA